MPGHRPDLQSERRRKVSRKNSRQYFLKHRFVSDIADMIERFVAQRLSPFTHQQEPGSCGNYRRHTDCWLHGNGSIVIYKQVFLLYAIYINMYSIKKYIHNNIVCNIARGFIYFAFLTCKELHHWSVFKKDQAQVDYIQAIQRVLLTWANGL